MKVLNYPLFYIVVLAIGYLTLMQPQEIEITISPDQLSGEQVHVVGYQNHFATTKNDDNSVTIHTYTNPAIIESKLFLALIGMLIYFGGLARWQKPKKKSELEKEIEHIESHPRYRDFIESNPENKYIYKEETASSFYKWLSENDANKAELTTPDTAHPTS